MYLINTKLLIHKHALNNRIYCKACICDEYVILDLAYRHQFYTKLDEGLGWDYN